MHIQVRISDHELQNLASYKEAQEHIANVLREAKIPLSSFGLYVTEGMLTFSYDLKSCYQIYDYNSEKTCIENKNK